MKINIFDTIEAIRYCCYIFTSLYSFKNICRIHKFRK